MSLSLCLCNCTNLSDRKIESPLISIVDIWEADHVQEVLESDPRLKGTIKVTPYKDRILVKFDQPSKPADEAEVRKSMRQIKEDLTKMRGRAANTLVFKFPQMTLVE